jgi:hypothetical protein
MCKERTRSTGQSEGVAVNAVAVEIAAVFFAVIVVAVVAFILHSRMLRRAVLRRRTEMRAQWSGVAAPAPTLAEQRPSVWLRLASVHKPWLAAEREGAATALLPESRPSDTQRRRSPPADEPSRRTARSERRSARAETTSDLLRVVVAADPQTALVRSDLTDLTKAALLYGDRVTGLSPVTAMLLCASEPGRASARRQMGVLQRTAPLLDSGPRSALVLSSDPRTAHAQVGLAAASASLRGILALLAEYLEVDPVVLRHDEAMSRKAFPGLSHQDDPQEIDVDDVGDLAVDAHAPARQLLPGHAVTWVAQVVDTKSGPESVTSIAVFMSHSPSTYTWWRGFVIAASLCLATIAPSRLRECEAGRFDPQECVKPPGNLRQASGRFDGCDL